MGSAALQNERRRERKGEHTYTHTHADEKEGGFGGDAARKMMCGRGETTSPQGVANLMTADWLCMEYTDTGGRPLYSRAYGLPTCTCGCSRARARAREGTCIDNVGAALPEQLASWT